jgi:hypothetical protein
VLMMKEALWKNNVNNVNDVPVIYVNFIVIVIFLPENKNRRRYFPTAVPFLFSSVLTYLMFWL